MAEGGGIEPLRVTAPPGSNRICPMTAPSISLIHYQDG